MQLHSAAILRKRAGVVSRALEDARIALRLDRSETLVFNRASNAVWDLFDGVHTVAEIAAETGLSVEAVGTFGGELVQLELFEVLAQPDNGARRAVAVQVSGTPPEQLQPQLMMREELAVFGGCTSASVACNTPSSTLGNGNGNGNPNGPPNPPPGRNK